MAEFPRSPAELFEGTISIEVRLDTLVWNAIERHREAREYRDRLFQVEDTTNEYAATLQKREQKAMLHALRISAVLDAHAPRQDGSWWFMTELWSYAPIEELPQRDDEISFRLKVEPVIGSSVSGRADTNGNG
jgi:hypothetical protein